MLITVLVLVGGLMAALSLFLYFGQGAIMFIPSRTIDITPDQAGLDYEDIFLEVTGGERINAWYFPVSDSTPSTRTVLFCHGNAGNISHRLPTIRLLLDLGVNVLIFDYRGYGRSEGKSTEASMYADVRAAYAWLLEAKKVNPANLFLFGRSLGGAVAIDLAVTSECAGLIMESSFTSTADMGQRLYPFLPVRWLVRYAFDSMSKIGQLNCRVLITHSPDDEMIPIDMGRRLFEAAAGEKVFVALEGGHNDRLYFDNAKYLNSLREFLGSTAVGRGELNENSDQIN